MQSTWMLAAALCFTLLAAVIKVAAESFSVFEIIFYRSLFGIFVTYWMLQHLGISIKTSYPGLYLLRCVVGTLCICMGVYIVWVLPLGTAQTLTYTSPLFFAFFTVVSAWRHRKAVSWFLVAAIMVGFFGIVLILRPTVDPSEFTAMLVGVLVGVTGAWADWMIRMLTEKGEPPYRIVFYFLTTGTIVGAALTLMTGGFHAIDFYGLPLINTLYQYSGVVFAVILGMFLFDDSFDWITILGIFIVCASGIAASLCGMKERENKRDSSALLHHD